jgi:hypothetical protein
MLDINRFKSEIQKYDVERPNLFTTYINMPMDMPDSLKQYMSKLYDPIMLLAQSVSLPGMQIATAPTKRYGLGPNQLMPTGVDFNNTVNVTYIADGSARLFTFFYLWLNHIIPSGGNQFAAGVPNETERDGETVENGNPSFILPYQSSYVSQIDITMFRGAPGKFNGSGIGSLALSLATSALGVPFLGSLLNSSSAPEYDLEPMRRVILHKAFPIAMSEMPLSMGSADTFSTFTVTFAYYKWELRAFEEKQASGSSGGLLGGLL